MITILAVSFQHLLVLSILILIVGLPIYLLIKSKNKDKQLQAKGEIESLGTDRTPINPIENDIKLKLEKYGRISEKTNTVLYYITFVFLLIFTILFTFSRRSSIDLEDNAYLVGTILGALITFVFYISLFTLMFNPIRKMYSRYKMYNDGLIDASTFRKFRSKNRTWTTISSIICIPLSFGIFGLLMIPHYSFTKNLTKIKI